jgi:hypothetical protein
VWEVIIAVNIITFPMGLIACGVGCLEEGRFLVRLGLMLCFTSIVGPFVYLLWFVGKNAWRVAELPVPKRKPSIPKAIVNS